MNCVFKYLIIFLILSGIPYGVTANSDLPPFDPACGLRNADVVKDGAAIYKNRCEATKASDVCQEVYKKIADDPKNKVKDYALNCNESHGTIEKYRDSRDGCLKGALWDGVIKPIWEIGEFFVDSQIESGKANAICDQDIEKKKAIYEIHNALSPKLLNVPVPSDDVLKNTRCANLNLKFFQDKARIERDAERKYSAEAFKVKQNSNLSKDEQDYIMWLKDKSSTADTKSVDLKKSFDNLMEEIGVKSECYNEFQTAAMYCEALPLLVGGGLAAYKLTKLGKLRAMAGLDKGSVTKVEGAAGAAMTPDQRLAAIQDIRAAGGSADDVAAKIRAVNEGASMPQRVAMADTKAQQILNRRMKDYEVQALERAHKKGTPGPNGYSQADKNAKIREMYEAHKANGGIIDEKYKRWVGSLGDDFIMGGSPEIRVLEEARDKAIVSMSRVASPKDKDVAKLIVAQNERNIATLEISAGQADAAAARWKAANKYFKEVREARNVNMSPHELMKAEEAAAMSGDIEGLKKIADLRTKANSKNPSFAAEEYGVYSQNPGGVYPGITAAQKQKRVGETLQEMTWLIQTGRGDLTRHLTTLEARLKALGYKGDIPQVPKR